MARKFLLAAMVLWLMLIFPLLAQRMPGNASVAKALEAGRLAQADSLFREQTAVLIRNNQFDSLENYVSLAGKIASGKYGPEKSSKAVYDFLALIRSKDSTPALMRKMFMAAAEYFSDIGQNQQGYESEQQALKYTLAMPGNDALAIAQIEYNLGVYAQRLAQVNISLGHHRKAFSLREHNPKASAEDMYLSANAMGSMMWYVSRYDSAGYFFRQALDFLGQMPENDLNRYFRPSIIQNNLAGLYGAEGKVTEGITAMEDCISNLQQFLASPEPHPKKASALAGLFEGIDNLAGLYKGIGDYKKAGDLLQYSYEQKKQKLEAGHPGIFISEILLGQLLVGLREYDKAIGLLNEGLSKLGKAEGDYLFWEADACYGLAQAYEGMKNAVDAGIYYSRSEKLFDQSYRGEYDDTYLQFLRNAAVFNARNGHYERALSMAVKGYDYIKSVQGPESLAAFYQLLNLAEVNYLAGHYREVLRYSDKGLGVLRQKINTATNRLDSVKMQVYQPIAIFYNLRAAYALEPKRDSAFLSRIASRLQEAMDILEQRKMQIEDVESISILMAEHSELIGFAKQLELELHELTRDAAHLERFMNLHEAGLYSRFRSRMDKNRAIRFTGLPENILEEERRLKAAVPAALAADGENSVLMNNYLLASQQWNAHLEKIKTQYPAYYQLRYGSRTHTLEELKTAAGASTIIRYFFTDTLLHALVITKDHQQLFSLDPKGIDACIDTLLQGYSSEKIQGSLLKRLYDQLWKPLEAAVQTEKLIIIPDGSLFNLSFELLTPETAASYAALKDNSLLARHAITYHYSLFMIGSVFNKDDFRGNYVAFVPGFSDEAKKAYLSVARDSVKLDQEYLSLLAQPNTLQLARRLSGSLDGSSYFNNASTISSFKQNAAGHTIIHIGTHAEYNNAIPERSRLIFAKDNGSRPDSNSLFLDDIYEYDISSDLTILAACESGKPGYQDGEGMISLAHAFNYAGSKSILTALWKIDEKASSQITEYFINNLRAGLSAGEALRKAKLHYLGQSGGRTLAPAYWAGLVLIGETPSLSFQPVRDNTNWIIAGAGLVLLAGGLFWFDRDRRKKILPS